MSVLSFDKIMYHPEHILAIKNETTIFPVHATISLSNHCNHKCLWCTAYEFQLDKAKTVDHDKLIKFLSDAKKRGLKAVTYVGNGEPTVYHKFSELVKEVNSLGIEQSMFTNGHLIDKFEKEIIDCFTWIRISLDAGSTEVHDKMHDVSNHFNKIIENVKSLILKKNKNMMVGIQYAVHHENIDDMYKSAEVVSQIGANYISVKPVFTKGSVGVKIDRNTLTHADISPIVQKITDSFASDSFEVFYRPHQVLSNQIEKNVLAYNKCVAGFFNINIYEDGEIIYCAPHKRSVGTLDDDLDVIEKRIVELSKNLDLSQCPAGCRYHELNHLIENILNPEIDAKTKHINFI